MLEKLGGGAHEAVVRKGEPLLSHEAKASLLSGKKEETEESPINPGARR